MLRELEDRRGGQLRGAVRFRRLSVSHRYKSTWLTPYWGDADRLANGNVLVTAGLRSATDKPRIFEARPSDGQVVWQSTLPEGAGSYQAERLSPPPLVQPL